MNTKKYYTLHYDFWFTKNKANAVLDALSPIFQQLFDTKKPNDELFFFALEKGEIYVGTVLVVFDTPPENKLLTMVATKTHNTLVDNADVYGEGEPMVVESSSNTLPFQFLMGGLILGDYSH